MSAYNGLGAYVFISYAHKDSEKVLRIVEKLQKTGANIWYDEGIEPADEWAETLALKIKHAALFLVFLTKNSIESHNVKREIYFAVKQNLPILTCIMEDVTYPEWLDLQIGISQSINTHVDGFMEKIFCSIPKKCTSSKGTLIYTCGDNQYYFKIDYTDQSYSIIQHFKPSNTETVLYLHRESHAFLADWICNAIEFIPYDGFSSKGENLLRFKVLSDCDHDSGVLASDMYFLLCFEISRPETETPSLRVIEALKKKKDEPFEKGNEKHILPASYIKNEVNPHE